MTDDHLLRPYSIAQFPSDWKCVVCDSGGVLTPGAAFAETSLLERLQRRGMQFTVVEKC